MRKTLETLHPHLENLSTCIELGWARSLGYILDSPVVLSKNSGSNVTNDFIFDEARRRFGIEQCVGNRNTLRGLVLEGLFIKFKKLNKRFLTANIQTNQVVAYNGQQSLPGFENMEHLIAGWLPDSTGTKLGGIYLIKPKSSYENEWRVELRLYLADQTIISTPLAPTVIIPESPEIAAVPKIKEDALARRKKKQIANG